MNRFARSTAAVALLLAPPLAARAAESGSPGVWLATVVDTAHVRPGATTTPIRVRLERLTSDERTADLVRVAREKGAAALRDALSGESVGRLEIDGRLGDPILYARRVEDAAGARLLVVADRSVSLREVFGNRRSADYPYTVVEIPLEGAATGAFYGAARLEPRRGGDIELDGLGILPERLMAVQPVG
jgi:hypothetical protein